MSFTRLFGLAGGICFGLMVVASAVMRTACEGDFEGCGTAGETAYAVSIVSAALALLFLALAGIGLLSRVVRRAR
jgi:hypothetical protein